MKINIHEQKIDIDLEEVAYWCANGDMIAVGDMLLEFCNHLEVRERECGKRGEYFGLVFGYLFQHISDSQLDLLLKAVDSIEESVK